LPEGDIEFLGQEPAKLNPLNFNLMHYVYSIALNAASGRLKLNGLAGLGPTLGLKSAGSVQGLP